MDSKDLVWRMMNTADRTNVVAHGDLHALSGGTRRWIKRTPDQLWCMVLTTMNALQITNRGRALRTTTKIVARRRYVTSCQQLKQLFSSDSQNDSFTRNDDLAQL